MKPAEFEQFLKFAEDRLSGKPDSEKIQAFIVWCKKSNIEELILRLSSEDRGGLGRNSLLDFTTMRMIVSKKSFARKFIDVGYIAGMAPFPYMVLSKNVKLSNIRKQSEINVEGILKNDSSNYFIWYSNMQEFLLRKGTETTVRNMVGITIMKNFLTVKTSSRTYNFTLPVNKNGKFEQIHHWLSVVLPVKVKEVSKLD
jgi:hypothetical protein